MHGRGRANYIILSTKPAAIETQALKQRTRQNTREHPRLEAPRIWVMEKEGWIRVCDNHWSFGRGFIADVTPVSGGLLLG